MGLMAGMIPLSFAFIIIPMVPVNESPSRSAILRALMSSRMSVLSGVSNAKAMALDSPLSICNSSSCCLDLSLTEVISTHSGSVSPNSKLYQQLWLRAHKHLSKVQVRQYLKE